MNSELKNKIIKRDCRFCEFCVVEYDKAICIKHQNQNKLYFMQDDSGYCVELLEE